MYKVYLQRILSVKYYRIRWLMESVFFLLITYQNLLVCSLISSCLASRKLRAIFVA